MTSFLQLRHSPYPRVLRGHPWVFAAETCARLPESCDGTLVELRDARNRTLGWGIYNGRSQIVWRRVSREEVRALSAPFFIEAIRAAIGRRPEGMTTGRLVWSEADGLPGLVVDRFERTLVVQTLTLAMTRALPAVFEALDALCAPDEIVIRNDAPARKYEGLEPEVRTRSGAPYAPRWVRIEGFEYFLDLLGAQKTGFFLDQRFQHAQIARYAKGRRVLDGFCNQGGFAMHCARAGAASVLAVDISADCVAQTARNAERNGVAVETVAANMFDWFTQNRDLRFDLIILDPPSFARNKRAVAGALRGYKELNLRAMNLLAPGGILATYSCSHGVSADDFFATCVDAAADARRDVRLLARTAQPLDHPVLLSMPESSYLKGFVLSL